MSNMDAGNRNIFFIIFIVIALSAALSAVLFYPGDKEAVRDAGRPVVSATIFPLYDIARNVAGDSVEVSLILPSGASPHTFEPSPSTLKAISRSDLVFAIGHGLDSWTESLAEGTDARIVLTDRGIDARSAEGLSGHGHEEEEGSHGYGPTDPHYWLDISNAATIAATIADELASEYPHLGRDFMRNRDVYVSRLDLLYDELKARVAEAEDHRMVTLHNAWFYFAESLGLEIVGTFEPSAGREPTPKYLAELMHAVEEAGVSVIYAEPQLSEKSIRAFTEDLGLSLGILDPLGGVAGRESYEDLMRYNVSVIVGLQ